MSHIVRWGDWVKLSMLPPPPFTGKFSIIHTNYFSFVLYSCRIVAEFKVNHYVCYCGTMNWITQNYILQQNGCYSIIWIPTYYIIPNWMLIAT